MDVALPTRSTKGHLTTALVRDHWYIACRSSELRAAPLARTIVGTPMVLFRAEDGRAAALLDRCAHRNVPLSLGYTEGARLVCRYHGWEFDGDGHCQRVPALCGEQTGKARRVPRFATIERQGFVWVYATPDVAPKVEAPLFPKLDDPRYSSVRFEAVFEASLHATVENILDVPHTAFLHRGLFRGVKKNEVTAIVRRRPGIVEAEYVGEPRPTGVLGSILAPQGGTVQHFDRFVLPSIAQVEYALGDRNHVLITNALTPESELVTRLHAVATFRVIVPHFLLKLALVPIAKRVVAQDAEILKAQTEAVKRFGGEQYASTDVDLLGPHILRMLKAAERGEPIDETVETLDEVRLLA